MADQDDVQLEIVACYRCGFVAEPGDDLTRWGVSYKVIGRAPHQRHVPNGDLCPRCFDEQPGPARR